MNIQNAKAIIKNMEAEYSFRREERLALLGMLTQQEGTRALLLEGDPGSGKTFLPEVLARTLKSKVVFSQFHSWTDDSELFTGVDVASAVAGDADAVRQDGVLAQAARLSETASPEVPVIVILDEVDKAPDRVEFLLLDWLQSGRVPIAPGEQIATNLDNILVFLTSNAVRQLGDALLRRVRRVQMQALPAKVVVDIVINSTGAPKGVATMAQKAAAEVATLEGSFISPQEICRLVAEMLLIADSLEDCKSILAGWAAKTSSGRENAKNSRFISALWAEVKQAQI